MSIGDPQAPITNKGYQAKFNLKKRQSTDDLKELESKGIFTRIGTTGKGTYYILKGAPKGHFIGHISHVSDVYQTQTGILLEFCRCCDRIPFL